MAVRVVVCLTALLVTVLCSGASAGVGYTISKATNFTLLASSGNSSLYQVTVEKDTYVDPILLVDVWGDSRYQMGFDYGVLLGEQAVKTYNSLLHAMFGDSVLDQLFIDLLNMVIDWQWNDWLSVQVPQEYLEEISGIEAGGQSIGISDLGKYISRGIVFANVPGDPADYKLVFEREWQDRNETSVSAVVEKLRLLRHQCSMFGVWGSRTLDGQLYSMRNLDWTKDTGTAQYKLITVYHPPGAIEHATIGYAGMWGALTGMSAAGITVAEANLEENEVTFLGFPWLLRLRYVMENARNLAEGKLLWEKTNNTVGFNHMIASAVDAHKSHAALALETMFNYTAYFYDEDPREQDATYTNPSSGQVQQIGFPLLEALYRTNHGYDALIRAHYEWDQSPYSWSMQRYMMAFNGFSYYQEAGIRIGFEQAINITSIMGDKGAHAYECQDNTDGSNVISATYWPMKGRMWAAWENGHGSTWRPAACNTYVEFDMSAWWTQSTDL